MTDNTTDQAATLAQAAVDQLKSLVAATAPPPRRYTEYIEPFPMDSLPPVLREYVQASAISARVPVEMVALPLLALLGAAIGNQLRLDIGNGWIERTALWVMLIAPTGGGKTPALLAARRPLDLLQAEDWTRWQAAIPKSVRHILSPTPFPRYYTTDPGMVDLVNDLRHVPGLAIVRDELVGIVRAMTGTGSRRDDRQHYQALWSSHPIAPSRRRLEPTWIPAPVVSIVGGIQPLLVRKMSSREMDGLIDRFIPIFATAGHTYWNEQASTAAPEPDLARVANIFSNLRHRYIPRAPDGLLIGRTPEAGAAWASWFNDNVDHLQAAPLILQGFYRKLTSHVARIALILHAVWGEDITQPVSAERMTQAIAIGEFCRAHMRRTMLLLGDMKLLPRPAPTLAQRLLRVLAEHPGPEGWLSRTTLQVHLGRPLAADFDEAVATLLGRDAIVHTRRKAPGSRKSADHYRLPGSHPGPSSANGANTANDAEPSVHSGTPENPRRSGQPGE